MKQLMVLIIAIVVPAAAMTDGGCRDDVQKFCKDVGEAKRAVVACLQQHMAEQRMRPRIAAATTIKKIQTPVSYLLSSSFGDQPSSLSMRSL